MMGRASITGLWCIVLAFNITHAQCNVQVRLGNNCTPEAENLLRIASTAAQQEGTPALRLPAHFTPSTIASILTTASEVANVKNTGARGVGGAWRTVHLHADGVFPRKMRQVHEMLLEAAAEANSQMQWFPLNAHEVRSLQLRTVELHTVSPGGQLGASILPLAGAPVFEHHLDAGSLITVSAMLAQNFSGGQFVTIGPAGEEKTWPMQYGHALVLSP